MGVATLLFAIASLAQGQAAYEAFDYGLGTHLAGANGGTGFSEPWRVTRTGPGTVVTGTSSGVIVAGLSYVDAVGQTMPVSGGAWQTAGGLIFGQAQRGTQSSHGAPGSVLWISFLVRQASTTTGTNYAMVAPGTGYGFGSSAMSAGIYALPTAGVGSFYDAGGIALEIGNAADKTTLVVVRIEFSDDGNDLMQAWFDPILDLALSTPDAGGRFDDFASAINGATLAWGDSRSFVFDELRIGADIGWRTEDVFRNGFED